MDGPTDDAATEPLEPSELLEPLNTLPTAHSALPGVHPDPRPLAPLPQPLPPLPPGLPPLEPRQHLLWWQGASAMVLAVVILLIANVGAGLLVLLAQHGVSGVAGMGSANAEELITFPMLAAGQVANLMAFLVVAALLPLVARVPHRSALGLGGAPASAFAFGAVAFAVQPICVAHLIDHLGHEEILAGTSALLLLHGAGSAAGPALGGLLMGWLGPAGLPLLFVLSLAPVAIFAWLQARRAGDEIVEEAAHFVPMVRTSATVLQMMAADQPGSAVSPVNAGPAHPMERAEDREDAAQPPAR